MKMYKHAHYPGPRSGVHFSTASVYSFLSKVLLLKQNISVVLSHYTNKLISGIAPLLLFEVTNVNNNQM